MQTHHLIPRDMVRIFNQFFSDISFSIEADANKFALPTDLAQALQDDVARHMGYHPA